MEYSLIDNSLNINIIGRIDATNASAIEMEIDDILNSNSYNYLVLDFDKIEYISSAGLRVILRISKKNENFKIINVSSEVYEIFEMTGFTEIINIEKAYKKIDITGLEVIGKGAKGTVYRYDSDTIIKVYNKINSIESIKRERILAKKAFILGVPTAISYDVVKVNEKYGSFFELLVSSTLTTLIKNDTSNMDKYALIFSNTLRDLHSIKVNDDEIPPVSILISKWLDDIKDVFDNNQYSKISDLFNRIKNDNTLLHMDYHTNNLMMQSDDALLIDMDTLCQGNIIFELGNICCIYNSFTKVDGLVEGFLNISKEDSLLFYNKFMDYYLTGFDELDKERIKKNAYFIGLIRLIRHLFRRNINTDIISKTKEEILDLLEKIDDLSF